MRASALGLFAALLTLNGCAESSFELAQESRLPKWFELPAGASRKDVKVTMDYYVLPWGREATFKLFDAQGHKVSEKSGKQRGLYPLTLKNPPAGYASGYPSYEVITVGSAVDVVEHRHMEPRFYMTDDSAVRKELGVSQ
jgi:hypothetical protein